MSKAFDNIDHSLLLKKLKLIGIRGTPLQWVETFLLKRKQRVKIKVENETYLSNIIEVEKGTPQGSVLSPLLFVVYLNDISETVKNNCSLVNYADDSNVLVNGVDFNEICTTLSEQVGDMNQWFEDNGLTLNHKKTNCVMFSTENAVLGNNDKENNTLQVLNNSYKINNSSKFLGVYIDCQLKWVEHIEHLCSKLRGICYLISFLRKNLQKETATLAYYANFYSVIRYGIVFWGSSSEIDKVFKLQKRCLRILNCMGYRDSCRSVFRDNRLLTIPGIYIVECLLFIRRYGKDFEPCRFSHDYLTRHKENYELPQYRLSSSQKGTYYMCMKIYNRLPDEIKCIKSFPLYRKRVKDHVCQMEPYSIEEYWCSS